MKTKTRCVLAVIGCLTLLPMAHAERFLDQAAFRDARADLQAQPQPGYVWFRRSCLRYNSLNPDLLILGDSIMDGWSGYALHVFPRLFIDAKVGRQFSGGVRQYARLLAYKPIRQIQTIVVELGTNGPVKASQVGAFMRMVGFQRKVIFVIPEVPRPWEREVQQLYENLPKEYGNVHLVYWNRLSTHNGKEIPAYFGGDGVHPDWKGIQVMMHGIQAALAAEKG